MFSFTLKTVVLAAYWLSEQLLIQQRVAFLFALPGLIADYGRRISIWVNSPADGWQLMEWDRTGTGNGNTRNATSLKNVRIQEKPYLIRPMTHPIQHSVTFGKYLKRCHVPGVPLKFCSNPRKLPQCQAADVKLLPDICTFQIYCHLGT